MSRLRTYLRLDFPMGKAQPGPVRFIGAMLLAVFGSVVACWAISKLALALIPSAAGYEHFRFGDYTKLTVIGVVIASVAWPLVTLASSRARRLFLWLAAVVTFVSLAPDLWILAHGQPLADVAALMVMHLALAVITYPLLVFGAPQRRPPDDAGRPQVQQSADARQQ